MIYAVCMPPNVPTSLIMCFQFVCLSLVPIHPVLKVCHLRPHPEVPAPMPRMKIIVPLHGGVHAGQCFARISHQT